MNKKASAIFMAAAFVCTVFNFAGTAIADTNGVAVSNETFPDPNLYSDVKAFDADGNDILDCEELSKVTDLKFDSEHTLSDVKGIDLLTELKSLTVIGSEVSSLDLSNNTNLQSVSLVSDKNLSSLELNEDIESFINADCPEITSLDLKDNKKLDLFYCASMNPTVDFGEESSLTKLSFADVQIEELDLSNFPSLTSLGLLKTGVTSIDLSKAPMLNDCEIDLTPINSIVLNENLKSLALISTDLESLDISSCPHLSRFYNTNEPVEISDTPAIESNTKKNLGNVSFKYWGSVPNSVLMTDISDIKAAPYEGVELKTEIFKDQNFLNAVREFDKDSDEYLTIEEIADIKEITLSGNVTVKDFSGIEYLTELKSLTGNNCSIKDIDLTCNAKLETLIISNNAILESIKVPSSVSTFMIAGCPNVSKLDLKDLVNLETFYMESMSPEIDFGSYSPIKNLAIADSSISKLDLSGFRNLNMLGLLKTNVSELDLSKAPNLTMVEIDLTKLSSLKLNKKLVSLALLDTGLKSVDISECDELIKYFTTNEAKEFKDKTVESKFSDNELGSLSGKVWGETPYSLMTDIEEIVTEKKDDEGARNFVKRLYSNILNREADEDGLNFWTNDLMNKNQTGRDIVFKFLRSPEFVAKNYDNEEYLKILYTVFFDREPDADGLKYWKELLDAKTITKDQVAEGFVNSPEWADTCSSYGIKSGSKVTSSAEADPTELIDSFVERMYEKVLGRSSDEDGKKFWAKDLAAKRITGEKLGVAFFTSKEMTDRNLSDEDYIDCLYETFLDRAADVDGKRYWSELLKDHTRKELIFGFTRSDEFKADCDKAGILPY